MASRKEQKEALRAEREKREAEAKAAERRRKMMGIGAAAALVIVAVVAVVLVIVLSGGDDGGDGDGMRAADPSNAEAQFTNVAIPPKGEVSTLEEAAEAANCTVKQWPSEGADHTDGPYEYDTNPPTSGDHFIQPAADGAYTDAPDIGQLVHELEHGRIILWFKPDASDQLKGQLKSLFDEDPFHMVLTPNETEMPYEVAASAWTRSITCDTITDQTWDALRLFRDRYRDQGPEKVP